MPILAHSCPFMSIVDPGHFLDSDENPHNEMCFHNSLGSLGSARSPSGSAAGSAARSAAHSPVSVERSPLRPGKPRAYIDLRVAIGCRVSRFKCRSINHTKGRRPRRRPLRHPRLRLAPSCHSCCYCSLLLSVTCHFLCQMQSTHRRMLLPLCLRVDCMEPTSLLSIHPERSVVCRPCVEGR